MVSAEEFLRTRLRAAGIAETEIDRLLASISGDIDSDRMIHCLAIDVATGALAIASLCVVFGPSTPATSREEIGKVFNASYANHFAAFTSTVKRDGVVAGELVSVMTIHKYLGAFKGVSRGSLGPAEVATEVAKLRSFGRGKGRQEDSSVRPLRGARPVTWISDAAKVDAIYASGTSETDATGQVVEQLGLPWDAGVPTDVVMLRYPPSCADLPTIGRPNSFIEDWESPGLFVTADGKSDWGETCPRTNPALTGLPELVHDVLEPMTFTAPLRVQYLGRVNLKPADRSIARDAARRRWTSLTGIVP